MSIFRSVFLLPFLMPFHSSAGGVVETINANGHVIYHVRPATVQKDQRAIISAAYDGFVLCHSYDGTLLWQSPTSGFFPFDLAVGDIDGDGLDEALVASSDGKLYAFDHDGKRLWEFSQEAPLYQACIARSSDSTVSILTGGIAKKLYKLSPEGKQLASIAFNEVVRDVRAGKFRGDGSESVAVVTANNGRAGFSLDLINPADLSSYWEKPVNLTRERKDIRRVRVFSVVAMDMNSDGVEEIVLSLGAGESANIEAYDGAGQSLELEKAERVRSKLYRMNQLAPVPNPASGEPFLVSIYGVDMLVYNLDGSRRAFSTGGNHFANIAYDPETRTVLLASNTSGDDNITLLHLDRDGWLEEFAELQPTGKLAQVRNNLATLAKQAEQFKAPAYQPKPRSALAIVRRPLEDMIEKYQNSGRYQNLQFAGFYEFNEKYDAEYEEPDHQEDFNNRHSGGLTDRSKILNEVAKWEAAQQPFFMRLGHGRAFGIDFYLGPQTVKEIFNHAPNSLRGFVFAELENHNAPAKKAAENQLQPLAQMCREAAGQLILLRNKNIFWNGICYTDAWRNTLMAGKFPDVFVPSMEETNSRTPELSLSGRVGLWLTGYFDRISSRVVADNATYCRMWEWGNQMEVSHYLRTLAFQASYGADILHVNVNPEQYDKLAPLFDLVEKGAIRIPERDEITSLSDVALAMRNPSDRFLAHGGNGHGESRFEPGEDEMVFDRLDGYWGGAPIPDYDFTHYAMGSRSRMHNFLPTYPYGLISMVPSETDLAQYPMLKSKIETDGEFFYDAGGNKKSASEYRPVAEAAVREASLRMPVRVEGDAAWSAVRLDPTHIRVLLLDSGYVDPADRNAAIIAQTVSAVSCRDILSGEEIEIVDGKMAAVVPMGSLRILDIEHE